MFKRDFYQKGDSPYLNLIPFWFLNPVQFFNYALGNVNLFIAFFLYNMLSAHKNQKYLKEGFYLSLAILFKPIFVILIPFSMIFKSQWINKLDKLDLKSTFSILIPSITLVAINCLIFLLNPLLLQEFLAINLGFDGKINTQSMSIFNPMEKLGVISSPLFFILPLIFFGSLFIYYMIKPIKQASIWNIVLLGFFLCYRDSWISYFLFEGIVLIYALINDEMILKQGNKIENLWIFINSFSFISGLQYFGLFPFFFPIMLSILLFVCLKEVTTKPIIKIWINKTIQEIVESD
jgi:hypothetical protein